MGRRREAEKRIILPDLKYQSVLVARFINKIMKDGKKDVSRKIVYRAFDIIAEKTQKNPLTVFETAVKNCSPQVEVILRRVGGATYHVPVPVRPERRYTLAMHWIIESAREKKGKPMWEKIAEEIINAYNNTGNAIKKKEDLHKLAEANRTFAHLAKF